MSDVFDLTTRAGIQHALQFRPAFDMTGLTGKALSDMEWTGKAMAIGAGILGIGALAAGLYIASQSADTPSPEQQSRVAGDLADRMKAQGAKSVKVKVNNEAVADMKSKIQGTFDVKGTKGGNVELEVTFD